MDVRDLQEYEIAIDRTYGGAAGAKYAILIDGEPWLVKFPESTKNFQGKHLPSYTTSPISEHVGSRVYAALGIPVHETMLGLRDGKIVVACKDFTAHATLHEFKDIKNTLSDEHYEGSVGSSSRGEYLRDALEVMASAPLFQRVPGAIERFWDMFVVDAFIRNSDRNNGNWGILTSPYKTELAPVYGNGNALFGKRNASLLEARVQDGSLTEQDVRTGVSFFMDEQGRHIHPLDFIADGSSANCTAALFRFMARADIDALCRIVEDIPERAFGKEVMPRAQKDFYQQLFRTTYETRLVPAAESLDVRKA